MTNININDNRENPIQTLVGIFLAALVGAILFGLVPGFFVASLLDLIIPLKAGPIWAVAILSTIIIIYISVRIYRRKFNQAITKYIIISAVLSLILVLGALFTQGEIFYGYTASKMFYFLEKKGGDETFQEVEINRGREKTKYLNWEQIKELNTSQDRDKPLQNLGFESVPYEYSSFRKYSRRIDNIELFYYGVEKGYTDYYSEYRINNKRIFNFIKKSIIRDDFTLIDHYSRKDYETWKFQKGNLIAKAIIHFDSQEELPYEITLERD